VEKGKTMLSYAIEQQGGVGNDDHMPVISGADIERERQPPSSFCSSISNHPWPALTGCGSASQPLFYGRCFPPKTLHI